MPVTIIFGAVGPYFAGAYFDAVGSYDGALITFASLWLVATVLILLARQPKPKVPAPALPAPAAPVTSGDPASFFEGGAQLERREPERRPAVPRPHDYMSDPDDRPPVRDYMHQ
jgi:hypothetical protein